MLEGLPPNNATHLVRLRCGREQARRIADLLVESADPTEVAAAAFEMTADAPSWESDDWAVEAFFAHAPNEAVVRNLIAVAAGENAAAAADFALVRELDWVRASLAELKPVAAGRFLVHGAHDRKRAPAHAVSLEIEASLAFGTGHHGSTRGCLLAFDSLLKRKRPTRVLDVGTGTGVLALAAAKCLRVPIACGDIDPTAVAVARANARRNGLSALVRPVVSRGLANPALRARAPYDLIFANILAEPLRCLAPDLTRLAARDAEIILSGLLARDAPGVISAYAAQQFFLAQQLMIEGWATLRLRRPQRPMGDLGGDLGGDFGCDPD